MKSDYKITKPTGKMDVQIEQTLIDSLKSMETYTKHSVSELVNTAVKRFVSQHKDFLPPKAANTAPKPNNK